MTDAATTADTAGSAMARSLKYAAYSVEIGTRKIKK